MLDLSSAKRNTGRFISDLQVTRDNTFKNLQIYDRNFIRVAKLVNKFEPELKPYILEALHFIVYYWDFLPTDARLAGRLTKIFDSNYSRGVPSRIFIKVHILPVLYSIFEGMKKEFKTDRVTESFSRDDLNCLTRLIMYFKYQIGDEEVSVTEVKATTMPEPKITTQNVTHEPVAKLSPEALEFFGKFEI